jgi:hypothetical protein
MERAMGIEPTSESWETCAAPPTQGEVFEVIRVIEFCQFALHRQRVLPKAH